MGHITSLLKNRPKPKERKAYMNKMWAGRQTKETDKMADDFNSSIHFDSRMYRHDVMGSIAHATMLAHQGIISMQDKEQIVAGLGQILEDIEKGVLQFDLEAEDIHMFIESELTARIGDAGKRLHTARSRNDQVAVDIRLYLRDEVDALVVMVKELIEAVKEQAKVNKDAIMPGYTHLQRAQPIVFGQHLLAYCMMLMRDVTRLEDARDRMNYSPLGSCALSGTTYNTDRRMTAELLGFDGIMENKDFNACVEELCRVKGIGLKVASCALLFGFGKTEAFPVDVWIKRVLEEHFPRGINLNGLGKNAGIAQQYLFYRGRYL